MQLFLTLNDFAGRNPFLDALMRGVYVATIPLLAVILLGLLILAPRGKNAPSRGKLAWAIVLALGSATLLTWGVEALAQSLDLGTISPRPFMTRWVNLLIVEPQDNSFPCVEVMVAVILSVGIWASNLRWGIFAAIATLTLMVARLFCGSNYGADIGVAAALGVGLIWGCMALCHAVGHRKTRGIFGWTSAFTLGATLLGTFIVMAQMPRFADKLQLPWGIMVPATIKGNGATRAARSTLQEGEGVAPMDTDAGTNEGANGADDYTGEAESEALSKRATLFLPKTEAELRRQLTPKALPFVLLDVEVAPVTFKDGSSYRAAAIRFEIAPTIPNVRALAAQRAAALVKGAFAADSQLDNVDVTGVVTGDAAQSDNSLMNFAGDEVPVFTASVQRRNLIVKTPNWANDPTLEGGLWLRTRSRLWINDKVLPRVPEAPQPTATPKPKPTTGATPTGTVQAPIAAIIPPVAPIATTTPDSIAAPTAKPSHATVVAPTASPIATATAQPKRIRRRVRPRVTPEAQIRPVRPRTRVPRRELRRSETLRRPRRNIERNVESP